MINLISVPQENQLNSFVPHDPDTLRAAIVTGLSDCLTVFEPSRKYALDTLHLWFRLFLAKGVSPSQVKDAFELWMAKGHRFPFPVDVLDLVKSDDAATKHTVN